MKNAIILIFALLCGCASVESAQQITPQNNNDILNNNWKNNQTSTTRYASTSAEDVLLTIFLTSTPTVTKTQRSTATEVTPWVEPSFTSAKPPSIEETAKWIPYINTDYHFKISYPETYGSCENQNTDYLYPFYQNELLLRCEKEWKIVLQIFLDYHEFSIEYLRKYAPTGLDKTNPTAQKIGNSTFYYYGRGGGGVWYPDQYFTNLSEKALIILFYVPSTYGSDPYEYRVIENKILYTFSSIG